LLTKKKKNCISSKDPITGAGALGSVPVASIEEVKFAYLEKKYCFTIRTHDQIFGVHADDAEGSSQMDLLL